MHEGARVRNFHSRLSVMGEGECVSLCAQAAGSKAKPVATLTRSESTFLLMDLRTKSLEELSMADVEAKLAGRFELPAVCKAELSVEDAEMVRKREERQAAADREAAKDAAIDAATLAWWKQQAALAAELSITFDDWQRIVKLLSNLPPMRVGRNIVMQSVAAGRAMVIDAAVEEAVAAPLHASAQAAAERGDQESKRKRGKSSITQSVFGANVTEMIDGLEKQELEDDEKAAKKRQKSAADACERATKQDEKVKAACQKAVSAKAANDPGKLAIADLVTLITWKGGKEMVPANTKAENKDALVQVWRTLAVPSEVLRAIAGEAGVATSAPTTKAKAVAKKKKDAEDSSDEDSSDEDSSDGEDDDDESDCEGEDAFEVKAIHGKKGKGKTLQYLVEWEGYTERTWEPAAYLDNNVVLAEWLEASS